MKKIIILLGFLTIGLNPGFNATYGADPDMPQSGFLQDYSLLKAKDPMNLNMEKWVYVNGNVDFSAYKKIILDDVSFFISEKAQYKGLESQEMADLGKAFLEAAIINLSGAYEFTETPGPGVMRLRIAITELNPNDSVTGTVTTIVPIGLAFSSIKKATTGSHIGMGSISFEGEILDSQSGEILIAGIDNQTGQKHKVHLSASKWGHAIDIFAEWARNLRIRLDKLSGRE